MRQNSFFDSIQKLHFWKNPQNGAEIGPYIFNGVEGKKIALWAETAHKALVLISVSSIYFQMQLVLFK